MENIELFNCSTSRVFGKIKKFWDLYGDRFPDHYKKYFKSNIYEIIENNSEKSVDDITKAIFNYLGLLTLNTDKESQFMSFFEQYFDNEEIYNKNIVSVTQNYIPTDAKKIFDSIDKGSYDGTIRVYGPNLVTYDSMHFPVQRKMFEPTDLKQSDDMLVSFSPKENAERLLHTAIEEKKELLLNFDGYVPYSMGLFPKSRILHISDLYGYAKNHVDSAFDVDLVNYSKDDDAALVLRRK